MANRSSVPIPGKMSEKTARMLINGIGRQLTKPSLPAEKALKLLEHQTRLQEELKQIELQRLKREIAETETLAASQPGSVLCRATT